MNEPFTKVCSCCLVKRTTSGDAGCGCWISATFMELKAVWAMASLIRAPSAAVWVLADHPLVPVGTGNCKARKSLENIWKLWKPVAAMWLLLCGTRKCRLVCLVVFAHFGAPLKGTWYIMWLAAVTWPLPKRVEGICQGTSGEEALLSFLHTRVAKLKDTLG